MSLPYETTVLEGLGPFRAFILSSWLQSYRQSQYAGVVPNHLYVSTHETAIEQLLERGATVIAVTAKDEPDQLMAWLCYEVSEKGLVVHYAYTKEIYRRMGLIKLILNQLGYRYGDKAFITFRTADSKYFPGFRFKPEIARRKKL